MNEERVDVTRYEGIHRGGLFTGITWREKALGVYLYHPLDSQGPVFLG
jgi:hypothetical protein